jgi:eukaryotic-like serine/threonine-protein kinase
MAEQTEKDSLIIKLALEKKLISQQQVDHCKDLAKKSKKIGLETTIEEILVKQGIISKDQLDDLNDMYLLAEGGTVFGLYRLGKLIGQGGMGKVYEAVHEIMGRSVAIKVINSQITDDKNDATRFIQEIRALAKLNHPNIVTIFDAGKINRRHYFAMELLPGPSLKGHVDSKKFLGEKEALKIIRATAKALGHAHAKSVIHRDVKPENIIFDCNGVPKLTDFGLVMHHDVDHMSLTQEGAWVGSYYYISPEQVDGSRDIDGRSDIYALGATLYYALTGRTAYTGNSPQELLTKHLSGHLVSPKRFSPKISRRTARLVKKMMAVQREKRYQTMEDVVDAIDGSPRINRILSFAGLTLVGTLLLFLGMLLERLALIVK